MQLSPPTNKYHFPITRWVQQIQTSSTTDKYTCMHIHKVKIASVHNMRESFWHQGTKDTEAPGMTMITTMTVSFMAVYGMFHERSSETLAEWFAPCEPTTTSCANLHTSTMFTVGLGSPLHRYFFLTLYTQAFCLNRVQHNHNESYIINTTSVTNTKFNLIHEKFHKTYNIHQCYLVSTVL